MDSKTVEKRRLVFWEVFAADVSHVSSVPPGRMSVSHFHRAWLLGGLRQYTFHTLTANFPLMKKRPSVTVERYKAGVSLASTGLFCCGSLIISQFGV